MTRWQADVDAELGGRWRSVGVEPVLGDVVDLSRAGAADAAVLPPSGNLRWRLTIDNV